MSDFDLRTIDVTTLQVESFAVGGKISDRGNETLLSFYPDGRVLMRGVPVDQLSREELIKGLKEAPLFLFPGQAHGDHP